MKHLAEWCELVGTFQAVTVDRHSTYVRIDGTSFAFHNGLRGIMHVRDDLDNINSGERIAILRTDLPENPLLIRRVSKNINLHTPYKQTINECKDAVRFNHS